MAAPASRRSRPAPAPLPESLEILAREFPEAECALSHNDAYQLLVATILSAQCTDARVNMGTPRLFHEYPDARSLSAAPAGLLEDLIRSTGFFNAKARSLRGMAAQEISRILKQKGKLRTLKDDAMSKVLSGVTTIEEASAAVMV